MGGFAEAQQWTGRPFKDDGSFILLHMDDVLDDLEDGQMQQKIVIHKYLPSDDDSTQWKIVLTSKYDHVHT